MERASLQNERMRKALSIGAVTSVVACLAIACQSTEDRPPISDGPGGGHGGGGSGSSDAGETSVDGGTSGALVDFTGYTPTGLAAAGDVVYVTLVPLDTTLAGKVDRIDATGKVTELVTNAASPSLPTVSASVLYYADVVGTTSTIERLDLSAATATPEAFVTNVVSPSALVATAGSLFIESSSGGVGVQVDAYPETGAGAFTSISSTPGEYTPAGMATDGSKIYYAAAATGGGQIVSAQVVGGGTDSLWSGSDTGTLGGVSTANGIVYFTLAVAGGNGVVYGVPVSGGAPLAIATGLDAPADVVATPSYVYYTTNTAAATGGVFRTTPGGVDAGAVSEQLGTFPGGAHLVLGTSYLYVTTDQAVARIPQ